MIGASTSIESFQLRHRTCRARTSSAVPSWHQIKTIAPLHECSDDSREHLHTYCIAILEIHVLFRYREHTMRMPLSSNGEPLDLRHILPFIALCTDRIDANDAT